MKAVFIHGQKHKRKTYSVAKLFVQKLGLEEGDYTEFWVNDIPHCVGCTTCIFKGEVHCPHQEVVQPIIRAIEEADIVIMSSPTYCMEMSGQLKTFCDHMAYRWMPHRPHASMDGKVGIAISTTAGAGANKVAKSIASQMMWWGMGRTYTLGMALTAKSWQDVKEDKKAKINKKADKIAKQVLAKKGKVHRGLKGKFLFNMMKMQQKNNPYNPLDQAYWKEQGWIE